MGDERNGLKGTWGRPLRAPDLRGVVRGETAPLAKPGERSPGLQVPRFFLAAGSRSNLLGTMLGTLRGRRTAHTSCSSAADERERNE